MKDLTREERERFVAYVQQTTTDQMLGEMRQQAVDNIRSRDLARLRQKGFTGRSHQSRTLPLATCSHPMDQAHDSSSE